MRLMRKLFVSAAATMFVAAAFASEPAKTLTSASGLKIELPWSKRWAPVTSPNFRPDMVGLGVEDDPLAMQVMISVARPAPPGTVSDERMLEVMEATIRSLAPQSVEQDLAPMELAGGRYHGWYFIATDKAPKPGEYQYFSQVMVAAGDAFVYATILYNESGAQDAQHVREALINAGVTFP